MWVKDRNLTFPGLPIRNWEVSGLQTVLAQGRIPERLPTMPIIGSNSGGMGLGLEINILIDVPPNDCHVGIPGPHRRKW